MRSYLKLIAFILTAASVLASVASCNPADTTEGAGESSALGETYYFDDGITEEESAEAPEDEIVTEYKYATDFSSAVKGDDPDWFVNESVDFSNGYLTALSGHSYFAFKHKPSASLVKIGVDLCANRPGVQANDAGYIALRLNAYDDQFAAVGQNGIWLTFQNGKVGIIDTWPTVRLFDSGFDFSVPRKVYVEDDQAQNIITVYVDEDGEKALAFTVAVTNYRDVTVSDRNGNVKINTTFSYDIPEKGHIALWSHQNNGNVTFDDLSIEWEERRAASIVQSVTQDFSKPLSSDKSWSSNSTAVIKDGRMVGTNQHCYFDMTERVRSTKTYVELDLMANRRGNAQNVATYVGLRVTQRDQFRATQADGLWIAFHDNKVGIISGWPAVRIFNTEFSFAEMSRVLIEDDTEKNTVTVYSVKDGKNSLVCSFKISEGKKVTAYNSRGQSKFDHTLSHELADNGFVCFWAPAGGRGESAFDNIEIRWEKAAPPTYIAADPEAIRDIYSDTWVATDDEGRTPNYGMGEIEDKLVGIFYQIWHTSTSTTYPDQIIYDHHAIYQKGGHAAVKDAFSKGPETWGHYWGQPYFGYYLTSDRWVIRKHASMLEDIGVDFIYLDVTNGNPMTSSYMAIFREYAAMRKEGLETPDICFFLADNASLNPGVFDDIWDNIYSSGQYSDLYVMYKGKPLILGNMANVDNKEALETFTVRRCWALKANVKGGKDMWTWMHESPQPISKNSETGEGEEISISAGILANTSSGRSNLKGRQPALITLPDGTLDIFQFELETTGKGLFFSEQMERAMEADTYVVLINAWNEWTASHWSSNGHQTVANTKIDWTTDYYVDCFNPEFSRDIEPMAGGFGDNYYYQLAEFLRIFKGSRTVPEASGQTDIGLKSELSAWDGVWPEYLDTANDTTHRDSIGFGGFNRYTNDSGRNDIISAKVSKTEAATYFLAVCSKDITAPEGENWMNLFVNTDCNYETGWYGYDIAVNRDAAKASSGKVTVERFVNGEWRFESLGEGEIYINGNYLVIRLDNAKCGITGDFDFKWADNSVSDGNIMQFLDMGDAAPNARFNYAYRTTAGKPVFSEALSGYLEGGAAFDSGKAYMAAGDSVYRLCDTSTAAKAKMYKDRLFAPVTALARIGASAVEISEDGSTATWSYGEKTVVFTAGSTSVKVDSDICVIPVAPFVENGVLYVPLNAAAFITGLNYHSNGPSAIISPKAEFPEGEDAEKLFSSLERSF